MTVATSSTNGTVKDYAYYDKYYNRACEVCVPIKLTVPVYVAPVVLEQKPECVTKSYN